MSLRLSNDALIAGNLDVSRTTNTRKLYAKGISTDQGVIRLDHHDDSSYIDLNSLGYLEIRKQNAAGRNISLRDNAGNQTIDLGAFDVSTYTTWGADDIGNALRFRSPGGGGWGGDRNSIYASYYTVGSLNRTLVVRGHDRLQLGVYGGDGPVIQLLNSGYALEFPRAAGTGYNATYNNSTHALLFVDTSNGRVLKESIDLSTLGGDNLGNHTAIQALDLSGFAIDDVSIINFTDTAADTNVWSLYENASSEFWVRSSTSGTPIIRSKHNGEVEFGGTKFPTATGSTGQVLTLSAAGQAAWQAASSLTFDAPLQLSGSNVTFDMLSVGGSPTSPHRLLNTDHFIYRDTGNVPVVNRLLEFGIMRDSLYGQVTVTSDATAAISLDNSSDAITKRGRITRLTNANAVTITVDSDTTNWPPNGTQYYIYRDGGGTSPTVNINRGTGVAFITRFGNVNVEMDEIGDMVTLIYAGSNTYMVLGDFIQQ